jgi:ATP-dependent RNA helicase DDX24/MAK5
MAPNDKKRSRPAPKSSQPSKKRQRTEPAPDAVQKRPVKLDGLSWSEVQLPDMFDDAEGFFGLEEVEGVDVVRDGDTLKFVRFMRFPNLAGKCSHSLGVCHSGNAQGR